MTAASQTTLQRLQEQYSDRLLSVMTILLLLMMFVVTLLHAEGIKIAEVFGMIVASMIAGVLVISASMTATAVIAFGFLLNVVVVIARLIKPLTYDLYLVATAWFVIACTLAIVVGVTVFGPGRVTFHRVVGAVLLYLLIALTFVSLVTLVGLLTPDAFSGAGAERRSENNEQLDLFQLCHTDDRRLWRYFANSPRCPQSMQSRSQLLVSLYPATLLARLVSAATH